VYGRVTICMGLEGNKPIDKTEHDVWKNTIVHTSSIGNNYFRPWMNQIEGVGVVSNVRLAQQCEDSHKQTHKHRYIYIYKSLKCGIKFGMHNRRGELTTRHRNLFIST
jgi:hypothetical protein